MNTIDQGVKYEDLLEGKVIEKKAEKWLPVDRSRISMNVKPKVNKATVSNHNEPILLLLLTKK